MPLLKRTTITRLLLASGLALPVVFASSGHQEGKPVDVFHGRWAYSEPALVAQGKDRAGLAWLAFDGERDRVCAALYSEGRWGAMVEVSETAGEYFAPALASAPDGGFWVAWAARIDGSYDVLARRLGPDGVGPLERVTGDTATDSEPALAVSPQGEVLLAWQGWRDGNQEVLAARRTAEGWSAPLRVTQDSAADIQPALAFDAAGRAWVAWSTWRHGSYADGNYEVYSARLEAGGVRDARRVSVSGRADLFPRLVRAGDRLALVWTESLFGTRTKKELTTVAYDQWRDKSYRVSWLEGEAFGEPAAIRVLGPDGARLEVSDFAQPVAAGRGVWLVHQTLFDRPSFQKRWGLALTSEGPAGTSTTIDASGGSSGPGGRFDVAWIDGQLVAVDTASAVSKGEAPVEKGGSWLRLRTIDPARGRAVRTLGKQTLDTEDEAPAGLMAEEPPRDRRGRVTSGGRELTAYFGNLHLHSDLSTDGRGHDGTPEMNYQVVHDLAELDFAGLSDHVEWWLAPDWWTVRKAAELWNRPGHFVTLPGYEWTSFKHGHKNVYFPGAAAADAQAAIRSLGKTPDDLWELLGEREALVIPHHPAHKVTEPTDWSFRSDRFQRLVEIFQVRGNYEYDGAPYQRGADDPDFVLGHSVQDALRMGHRLGIIASPDHGGGFGLAGAWADGLSRESIYAALHARRTFGTTGAKLDLWFTVEGAPQGSELEHRPGEVALHAEVGATADGLTLTIVSDGEDLESFEFEGRRAVLDWVDRRAPARATRYYYLRARQGDGHLGWTSPVWIEGSP